MSGIDITTLREGDTVLVRGRISKSGRVQILSVAGSELLGIGPDADRCDIVSVEPLKLIVGDKVKAGNMDGTYDVVAIDGNAVWIRLESKINSGFIADLIDLVRA